MSTRAIAISCSSSLKNCPTCSLRSLTASALFLFSSSLSRQAYEVAVKILDGRLNAFASLGRPLLEFFLPFPKLDQPVKRLVDGAEFSGVGIVKALHHLRAASVDEQPLLKISFAPDAREADIRLLLVAIDGQLAGGPGQLGDYYVRVPQGRLDAALQRLKNDPLVQAAATAPGLPPRE